MKKVIFPVVIIILVCLWMLSVGMSQPKVSDKSNKVVVYVKCFQGYKFLYMRNGNITQLLNEYGQGIPCKERI